MGTVSRYRIEKGYGSEEMSKGEKVEGVYLLHFDVKLHRAGHYIGWSSDIQTRIKNHQEGKSGVALLNAVARSGRKAKLVRIWRGADRYFERMLKRRKKAKDMCPICNPKHWRENA